MWPQPMMELLQANFKAVGIDMKITPLEWNNILTIQRASFNAPGEQGLQRHVLLGWLAGADLVHGLLAVADPAERLLQPDHLGQPGLREADPAGARGVRPRPSRNEIFNKAMGVHAEDSPVLFVVHDLNLRVLSPEGARLRPAAVVVRRSPQRLGAEVGQTDAGLYSQSASRWSRRP